MIFMHAATHASSGGAAVAGGSARAVGAAATALPRSSSTAIEIRWPIFDLVTGVRVRDIARCGPAPPWDRAGPRGRVTDARAWHWQPVSSQGRTRQAGSWLDTAMGE